MTDTWEKRAIAYTPGYNTPGATLTFSPVYNGLTDELVVTASHPVFGSVDQINFQGSNGNGSLTSPADFTVDSPTQITIPGAYAALLGPPDLTLTQLDFYNPGPVLVGTWTGSVSISSMILTYDQPTDTLTFSTTAFDMTTMDQITFNGIRTDTGPFSSAFNYYDFTSISTTDAVLVNAWDNFFFALPTDSIEITDAIAYGPGPSFTQLGSWIGSVIVDGP